RMADQCCATSPHMLRCQQEVHQCPTSHIRSSATTRAGPTWSMACSRNRFRPTRRRLRRPARPPPSHARPRTRRSSNTKTRRGTGTPRRPPAGIVRLPTSRTRIDRRASRVAWVERSASHVVRTTLPCPLLPPYSPQAPSVTSKQNMAGRWYPTRVFAWLLATACAAHAGEATAAASGAADQFKLMIGSVLMSDYIYRGISYSAHQPSVGTYIDAQQGWLYGYTNFNSVRFSTSPAVEVTMAVGARPTLGPFEFDIGAAYYYYPGELGPELSNYWEAHATVSYKLTDKITLAPTLAYSPNVWQTGAWGTYAAGTFSFDLPSEFLPADVGWTLSF